jgi:hypothetical protein
MEIKDKGKDKHTTTMKKENPTCTHYKKEGNNADHYLIVHPELKPKCDQRKKRNNTTTTTIQ